MDAKVITREAAAIIPGDVVLGPAGWVTVGRVLTETGPDGIYAKSEGHVVIHPAKGAKFRHLFSEPIECRTR